jgi:two-component system, chemotaxis family, chemotaxis protein CheY
MAQINTIAGLLYEEKPAVLVVDDQEMMTELISVMLQRMGFAKVDRALNGNDALHMLRNGSYGLIISDLNMEPMSGLQLIQAVRRSEQHKHLPFLMTTASLNSSNAMAAKIAGVDNYLLKPFTPDLLRVRVHSTLRGTAA